MFGCSDLGEGKGEGEGVRVNPNIVRIVMHIGIYGRSPYELVYLGDPFAHCCVRLQNTQ